MQPLRAKCLSEWLDLRSEGCALSPYSFGCCSEGNLAHSETYVGEFGRTGEDPAASKSDNGEGGKSEGPLTYKSEDYFILV